MIAHLIFVLVDKLTAWSAVMADSEEEQEKPKFFISYFESSLLQLQEMVDAALSHIKLIL